MSGPLLLAIAGLAALDAFNPATIVAVTLILLAAPGRPGLTALVTVLGAALTVFGAGAALFLGAGAATGAVDGIVQGIRYVAFAAAGLVLILSGVRRFRTRPRAPIALPTWFTPWTALPFGALLTGADLPNAFPYFIAIERLLDAQVTPGEGLLILAGYAVIYCFPCLVLLAVGVLARRRTHALLSRITRRLGTGDVAASPVAAVALILLGALVASLPFWALR
ncbi:Sap-like sulfolipid-1-addressing protein [Glaciihabitans tibetensis]|uniref:Sap-like sulfolipid-1-addressing protein n=1 Tax=Glaciihabitans tibetensis TaxID=1266600 RepID=A0A2T0VH77_9MICO|nr:GAP family protein [Glaciihabitans tibetensis]PRY69576.1 Sap-like sulfolipid-1-addressing protein [Glaciihabitans tibetensis]